MNLNLLKQLGIIKTTNWREYQKVIYNIYLTLFYLNYFGNIILVMHVSSNCKLPRNKVNEKVFNTKSCL